MAQGLICPARWEKLLVCTDGSLEAQGAVAQTLALAQPCGSTVYAVQVLEISPEVEAVAPDLRGRLEKEIRTQMAAIQGEADKMGVPLAPRIRHHSSPLAVILEEIETIQPNLVIMGRSGRTGLARLLMGSVTARVIGHSPVNVLVVPQDATLAFHRILIAADGSPFGAAAWKEALSLTIQGQVSLFAVAVAQEEGNLQEAEKIVGQMRAEAGVQGVSITTIIPQGQAVADAIVQVARRQRADLIILGSHGRTGLSRLLMGSVTERVIGQAPCPVMVVKKR